MDPGGEIDNNSPKRQQEENPNPALRIFMTGAVILFIGLFLGNGKGEGITPFTSLFVVISCALATYSGIIVIIRKEAPRSGLPSIRGIGAIVSGLSVILTFGIGGFVMLVLLIRDLFALIIK